MDPSDPEDIAAANAVQDGLSVLARSAQPFVMPDDDDDDDDDDESFNGIRSALLQLIRFGGLGTAPTFGTKDDVSPIHHLLGTAGGWGGLPEHEACSVGVEPTLPVREYKIEVGHVPVDAFWSISVHSAAGLVEPNDRGACSVNSVTASKNGDGSTTVRFSGCADGRSNCLPISEGWNSVVRLYRPRPEKLGGGWTFPSFEPV
jgi:hypothetical protein